MAASPNSNFRLSLDDRARWDAAAISEDRTLSSFIKRAVELYIAEKHPRLKKREAGMVLDSL